MRQMDKAIQSGKKKRQSGWAVEETGDWEALSSAMQLHPFGENEAGRESSGTRLLWRHCGMNSNASISSYTHTQPALLPRSLIKFPNTHCRSH
jgi:hypothetical protein